MRAAPTPPATQSSTPYVLHTGKKHALAAAERHSHRAGPLRGCADARCIAELARPGQLTLVITADTSASLALERELPFFLAGWYREILAFPDWETLPYDNFSPHQDIISERLHTLHRLRRLDAGILVVPIPTLMHRLAPADYIAASSLVLTGRPDPRYRCLPARPVAPEGIDIEGSGRPSAPGWRRRYSPPAPVRCIRVGIGTTSIRGAQRRSRRRVCRRSEIMSWCGEKLS